MALKGFDLFLVHEINNFRTFRYDTLDTIATVEASGYFTRTTDPTHFDDELVRLEVGDEVQVYVWSTTIRTGTFVSKAQYRVTAVTTAGVATIAAQDMGSFGTIRINRGVSGGTPNTSADEFVIEGDGPTGLTIMVTSPNTCGIYFADNGDPNIGQINYFHNGNAMSFVTNNSQSLRLDDKSNVQIGLGTASATTSQGNIQLPINTSPTAVLVGGIVIGAKDSSQGSTDATLELWLETDTINESTFTVDKTIPIWINGNEYLIGLDAV